MIFFPLNSRYVGISFLTKIYIVREYIIAVTIAFVKQISFPLGNIILTKNPAQTGFFVTWWRRRELNSSPRLV